MGYCTGNATTITIYSTWLNMLSKVIRFSFFLETGKWRILIEYCTGTAMIVPILRRSFPMRNTVRGLLEE
jgi:hypothetical protein